MSVKVKLSKVAEQMEVQSEEVTAYLNPRTGEFVTVTEDDTAALEIDDEEDLPDWQREGLPKVREALESDEFIQLPSKFEIHEWSIMQRFATSMDSADHRESLLDAIHGRGAFRMFKSTLRSLGLVDQWYRFRDDAMKAIAAEWLEANDIPYERD